MTLANSQLIPEFQYYFNLFVISSVVNKNEIPAPVSVDLQSLTVGSVVQLLFDDNYPYDYYNYLYQNEDSISCWPALTRQRLMIYQSSQYLIPGTEGDSIFNLKLDDFTLLDSLLVYRQDSTSLNMIDTTGDSTAVLITDATTGITTLYANLDVLSTALSKEVYLYLKLHIYESYEGYNSTTIISDSTLLATCFEFKLIDDYFTFMTTRDITFDLNCPT